jgi:hypothetical protein
MGGGERNRERKVPARGAEVGTGWDEPRSDGTHERAVGVVAGAITQRS